jgi:hypothetical protein
MEEMQMAY